MGEPKRVFVSIYCKIYTDCFSLDMFNKMATGQEIYDFLMRDAGMCRDDDDQIIPGDCNLWYLGCNDMFGCLRYNDHTLKWGTGESSFAIVEAFITLLYIDRVFNQEQYEAVIDKSKEGRLFDHIYDIPKYLKAKQEGKPWTRTKEAREFRLKAKRFASRISNHLEEEGFLFVDPGLRW